MRDRESPTSVLRQAWCEFRLSTLQEVVAATIVELKRLQPAEVLGLEGSRTEPQVSGDPIREALAACSDELRSEAGIAASGSGPVTPRATLDSEKGDLFDQALIHYRRAASRLLLESFRTKSLGSSSATKDC